MEEIRFIIPFQPLPFKRMTRNEIDIIKTRPDQLGPATKPVWDKLQAYLKYKRDIEALSSNYDYPRNSSKKVFLHVNIYLNNKKHGDPINYWKAIADSLFKRCKFLSGSFDFFYDETPRSEVMITCEPGEQPETAVKQEKDMDNMTQNELLDKAF